MAEQQAIELEGLMILNQNQERIFETCEPNAGRIIPVVNPNRCECKGSCVEACPYSVFVIRPLTQPEKSQLSWLARAKVWMHGGSQAFVVAPDACHACGKCAAVCPESAISFITAQT